MRFVAVKKKQKIVRPKTAKPAGADYAAIQGAADRKAPAVRKAFRDAVNTFRDKIDVDALAAAMKAGRFNDVYSLVDWTMLESAREPLTQSLAGVARAAGRATAKQMQATAVRKADGDSVFVELLFNGEAKGPEDWAKKHAGTLIQGITDESLASVRDTISTTIRTGEDYGKSAQKIKDAVGLTRQGANALGRYRDGLEEGGASESRVERLTGAYRERLLRDRAETISRTETIKASNQGAMMYWQDLVGNGAIRREDAQKTWVVTPDDRLCPICEPLGGVSVGLDDSFITELGTVDAPPAHPNCRCAISLRINP